MTNLAGGYHVCFRATNSSSYKSILSTLTLPSLCNCQEDSTPTTYDGTFPEFFHGFYAGNYGLDAGVVFKNQQWNLFYHTLSNTATPTDGMVVLPGVAKGETVLLSTYFDSNRQVVVAQIFKNYALLKSITVPLTSGAASRFAQGATINREICMASNNAQTGGIPSNAVFSDTTFVKSTLSTINDSYPALSNSNSRLLPPFADNRPIDTSRYGTGTGTSSDGFVWDMGSCSFI